MRPPALFILARRMQRHFIPLPEAAASAFQRLASDPRRGLPHAERVLDVSAIALAACIPVYGAGSAEEPLRRLTDDELARGTFCDGATRLAFPDGAPPLEGLAVLAQDLRHAVERLGDAGVSFSHARFDLLPRAPRYMFG